jgi:hypothetical protein
MWKKINDICSKRSYNNSNLIPMKQWKTHFQNLLSKEEQTYNFTYKQNKDALMDAPINCQEVKKVLRNLKIAKAAGMDLICNEFLKYGSDTLVLPLVQLLIKL